MPGQLWVGGVCRFLIGDGDSHLLMQHNGLHKGFWLYCSSIRGGGGKKKSKILQYYCCKPHQEGWIKSQCSNREVLGMSNGSLLLDGG